MMNDVLEMLASMFQSILALFDKVFAGLDGWDIVLGAFIVITIYRMLLVPILGGRVGFGSSDTVKKSRGKEEDVDG